MPMVVMSMSIPDDKFDSWRAAVTEMTGRRRDEFDAARRRQGITRQGVWVQRTPEGAREILVLETEDPRRAFEEMATSDQPFDVWLREMLMDVYKLDLTAPEGPLPEQILDWSANRD